MGARRRGREAALKILYSVDMNPCPYEEVYDRIVECEQVPEESRRFILDLVDGTLDRLDTIDELIGKAALKWEIKRMAAVDRNILRLAISELTGRSAIPVRVVIDEAIELAKKYGGEESGTFVNGILDRIRMDLELET
jgi:N utilization substance protein B